MNALLGDKCWKQIHSLTHIEFTLALASSPIQPTEHAASPASFVVPHFIFFYTVRKNYSIKWIINEINPSLVFGIILISGDSPSIKSCWVIRAPWTWDLNVKNLPSFSLASHMPIFILKAPCNHLRAPSSQGAKSLEYKAWRKYCITCIDWEKKQQRVFWLSLFLDSANPCVLGDFLTTFTEVRAVWRIYPQKCFP